MLAAISFSPTDGIDKADSTHVLTLTCIQVCRANLAILVNMYLRMCERITQERNCQVLGGARFSEKRVTHECLKIVTHTHATELATSATCVELPTSFLCVQSYSLTKFQKNTDLCLTCICSKQTLSVLAKILNF